MEILVAGLVAVLSIVGNVVQYNKSQDLKNELEIVTEKGKIHVNIGQMTEDIENIALKIPLKGQYYLDSERVESLDRLIDREEVLYYWEYTLNFGYDYPDTWNWCPEVDQSESVVTMYVPMVQELKLNAPDIDAEVLNGSFFDNLRQDSYTYAKSIINETINDYRLAYLHQGTTVDDANTLYAEHLKELLNQAHHGHNPISKVRLINSEIAPKCNQTPPVQLTGQVNTP